MIGQEASRNATSVRVASFSGGIFNSGTISVAGTGILVGGEARIGNATTKNTASVAISIFSGGISNSGILSAAGDGIWVGGHASLDAASPTDTASVTIATFTGGISNSGTLSAGSAGILVGGTANIGNGAARGVNAASVTISTFSGGISNSGLIDTGGAGIWVGGTTTNLAGGPNVTVSLTIATFSGGIGNSGTIDAGTTGIRVDHVLAFGGGISNAGTISAGQTGIFVNGVSTFTGGINNSGTISATGVGLSVLRVSTFSGGITNSGKISAGAGASGIGVESAATFSDGISNAGTIFAGLNGIFVGTDMTFAGGISNSGAILSAASGNGINVNFDTHFTGGISNSGVISLGGVGIYVAGVTTFSGNISNSGTIAAATGIFIGAGVTFAAGSAIVNTGTITGTAGAAIDLSAATSPVTVDVNGGAINGNMLGAGFASGDTLNFALGGTFTYSSNFTNFETVNINSGTVILNGADSAATVAVNTGGTLAGTGSIDPPSVTAVTVNSGGTLAPGTPGTPGGTLTISANVTFEGGSSYQIAINPTQNSLGTVNGAVTINGGTVVLVPVGSSLGSAYTARTFTILESTGLTGAFSPTAVYGGSVKLSGTATVTDVGNDVQVSYGNSVGLLSPPSNATINEQNVSNGINNAILEGDSLPPAIGNLGTLSGPALLTTLNQLDGQDATGAQTSTFQLMTDFMNLLTDPSSGGGGNPTGGGAPGFAPEQEASLPLDIAQAYAAILTKKPAQQQQNFEQRWSAWGSAFGGTGKLDGDPVVGSNNVTASDYGFAAGMDYHATPNSVYGFAVAGGGTNWSVAQNLGSGRSDSFQIGVHDTTHWGPFYLSGALAFANHWFTTNRVAVGDQLQAKFDGQSYAARGEAGYRYAVPVTGAIIGVTPYAALQVQDFHTPSFSETDLTGGGLGLSFASQNATDTRTELGARFDNVQVVNAMPLVLRARVAWAHDWISNQSLGAVFQALPGSNFTVNGAAVPQNSALTTAAAELHINANWTAIAKFDGEFASTAQTYSGTGTLKYSW